MPETSQTAEKSVKNETYELVPSSGLAGARVLRAGFRAREGVRGRKGSGTGHPLVRQTAGPHAWFKNTTNSVTVSFKQRA